MWGYPKDDQVPDLQFNEVGNGGGSAVTASLYVMTLGEGMLRGIYAGGQVSSQQQIQTARNAEVQKLGATGPSRIDALTTFFRSYLGEADGNAVMARAFTAADVQRLEKLVGKITTLGGAPFRGNGREPPQPAGRLSDEQIKQLTPAQRLDYSRQWDQSTMPAWRDPRSG